VCTELGPAECYSHRPRVAFRPRIACLNHGCRGHHCFPTTMHRPWVPTAPWFSAPTCATLALAYNLYELNVEGFPFTFSSLCFPTAPLSIEHRHTDQPLRLSPEVVFAATTSAQARCRSPTSEPVPSATPPACHRWSPSHHTRCRGWPIPGELLHPSLLSSIHCEHSTFSPLTLLPYAGALQGARSRHCASALPAPTPFTGESLAPHAIFQPPPLATASHRTGRFSTGLEPRVVVICQNRPRHR
jgi:hypothetical protein